MSMGCSEPVGGNVSGDENDRSEPTHTCHHGPYVDKPDDAIGGG